MEIIKRNLIGLVAIVIAITGCFLPILPGGHSVYGSVTNYDEVDATALKIGGTNGTRIGPIIAGTCALIPTLSTQTASSTAPIDCAVTGVVSGDYVGGSFSTSTANSIWGNTQGWAIVGAKASTTAGFITFMVANFTGTASNVSTVAMGSSTNYYVLHPVTSVPGL